MKNSRGMSSNETGDTKMARLAGGRDYWEGRAVEFSDYASSTDYPEAFIKIMRLKRGWTVLDMACGGGTLAIPLSRKVRRVTAVDFSRNMLDILERRCRQKGIVNVDAVHGRWDDDWASLGLVRHDVAIASRSLMGEEAEAHIGKLCAVARKAVYISVAVGSGPLDVQLLTAAGREVSTGPDYVYFYNLLYHMGLRANVAFLRETHDSQWRTFDDAVGGQRWMFRDGLTAEEEQGVRKYLEATLQRVDGWWRFPYPRQCYWAVMWWETGDFSRGGE